MIGQRRTSEHEHAHHLWNRRRLHSSRTIVARDGIASRQCVVAKSHSYQLDSARHHLPCRPDLESLARSRVDLLLARPLRRLIVRRDYLFLFDVRLLLESVPT